MAMMTLEMHDRVGAVYDALRAYTIAKNRYVAVWGSPFADSDAVRAKRFDQLGCFGNRFGHVKLTRVLKTLDRFMARKDLMPIFQAGRNIIAAKTTEPKLPELSNGTVIDLYHATLCVEKAMRHFVKPFADKNAPEIAALLGVCRFTCQLRKTLAILYPETVQSYEAAIWGSAKTKLRFSWRRQLPMPMRRILRKMTKPGLSNAAMLAATSPGVAR